MKWDRWYAEHRHELSGQGLWLRGGEMNTQDPSRWESSECRALWVRLSTYMDVGYSFTHQILYQWSASVPEVFPDLAYLPPPKDAEVFARDGVPWLLGTQSKRGALDFDMVGFSNSIVQELINLPHFLNTSGIPLGKSERMKRPDVPLLILGGANSLFSWAALQDDPWVDGLYVGESDEGFKKILTVIRDAKREGASKSEILGRLEKIPGFLQPEGSLKTKKNFVMNLNESEALASAPVLFHADQAGSGHLQISEGCPCFCSFCAEAWERRPYRERSAATLKRDAFAMKAALGLESIDIYSFNFNMHSELYQVLWDLVPVFRHIGLKSQRFDLLAHDPEMLKFQQTLNKTSITCGLEGISPRLREYLNKNVSVDELHTSLEAIFRNKARELKVFLIATGLEEDQDFVALGDFLEHVRGLMRKAGAATRVIFSMTPLVRFPWTPLEFENAPTRDVLSSIVDQATRIVRGHGFEFRESAEMPEFWVSQVLARADRPGVTRALAQAIKKTGFVYYREITEPFRDAFEGALRDQGLSEQAVFAGFDLETSRAKPWARVDVGVFRDFLWKMHFSLQAYKSYDYCLGRSWAQARCSHCGGCPTRFHVRDIVLAKQKKPHSYDAFKARYLEALHDENRVGFEMDVGRGEQGQDWIGVPRRFAAIDLARALMKICPELIAEYRGYRGSMWDLGSDPVWIEGRDRLELAFTRRGVELLEQFTESSFLELQRELHARSLVFRGLSTTSGNARVPLGIEISGSSSMLPKAALQKFLDAQSLKYSLRRVDSDTLEHDWTAAAKKKDVLRRAVVRTLAGRTEIALEMGDKFKWDRFQTDALGGTFRSRPWEYRVRCYGIDNSIAAAKPN